jgi:ankyrin repeat protein
VHFLLQEGADPNSASDTNRTPLWRASFNGHFECCKILLEAGGDPDARDKVSHESTFDIAKSDEIRELIGSWDRTRTTKLMEARRRVVLAKIEERIKTSAEREQYARAKIRAELVAKAESGDVDAVKEMLLMIAEEVTKTNARPRATAEVRNETGQSLLSIAAQYDHEELAEMLINHWKKCDADRWDLAEGEISVEATVFKTNVNSRDLKGWNCACIAVFHESKKVLALLLEAGADPNMRSSYNKNAWDLAKDDLDAAEHVVKSRAEIRQS